MADALAVIVAKRRRDGRWNGGAAHPGQVHAVLERAGTPSRWITLMALRVLARYGAAAGLDAHPVPTPGPLRSA